jgi:hypothetical protein
LSAAVGIQKAVGSGGSAIGKVGLLKGGDAEWREGKKWRFVTRPNTAALFVLRHPTSPFHFPLSSTNRISTIVQQLLGKGWSKFVCQSYFVDPKETTNTPSCRATLLDFCALASGTQANSKTLSYTHKLLKN